MANPDITDRHIAELLDRIEPIFVTRGITRTSMDLLASRLQMSKRTLYEIFGSKDDLVRTVFELRNKRNRQDAERIFRSSTNAMEAMAKIINYHRSFFEHASVEFFRDLDERNKHLRPDYDEDAKAQIDGLKKLFRLGVRQGVFRSDADYDLQMRLLKVQMESLKRMEEYFPSTITLSKACATISRNFLTVIATEKGRAILDDIVVESEGGSNRTE